MKKLLVVGALFFLSGCGQCDRVVATWTGGGAKTCVDGVTYLQFTSGATVQVDRSGKPVPCGDPAPEVKPVEAPKAVDAAPDASPSVLPNIVVPLR